MLRNKRYLLALALLLMHISQAESQVTEIEPADVYVHVMRVGEEIALIRDKLGEPFSEAPQFMVSNAAPREVYFQAQTLFEKANRLCFELTRQPATELRHTGGNLRPADVYVLVDAALDRFIIIKRHLDIKQRVTPPPRDAGKRPTDVFNAIIRVNYQLDLMLKRHIDQSDVFRRTTEAIAYAACLIGRFPRTPRIPVTPVYLARKENSDCFLQLLQCFQTIREIANLSGIPDILHLSMQDIPGDTVLVLDLYNVASILVSELAYLHSRLDDAAPARQAYDPGPKTSEQVYQRISLLEKQLGKLKEQVAGEPNWLQTASNLP